MVLPPPPQSPSLLSLYHWKKEPSLPLVERELTFNLVPYYSLDPVLPLGNTWSMLFALSVPCVVVWVIFKGSLVNFVATLCGFGLLGIKAFEDVYLIFIINWWCLLCFFCAGGLLGVYKASSRASLLLPTSPSVSRHSARNQGPVLTLLVFIFCSPKI